MPTCAASSTRRPTETPCAMCTRLSILVPARIRVSPIAGTIDRRVGANLHVVLDDDVGVLRDLQMRSVGLLDEAEAIAADHRAVLQRSTRWPRTTRSRIDTCAWSTQSSPMRAPRADHDVGVDDGARADGRARPDRDERTDRHVLSERGIRGDGAQRDRCPFGGRHRFMKQHRRLARSCDTDCRCGGRRKAPGSCRSRPRITAEARGRGELR